MTTFEARGKHIRNPIEVRADGDDGGILVEGYAAVYNQAADIGGLFSERIAKGAFDASLARGDDVVFLINHDDLPLGRTSSGTLTLTSDDHGLKMRSRLDPADPDVARIVGKMKRGDLDKMSFAFVPERDEWDDTGDIPARTLLQASLRDVSIVTQPAYDGTEIGLRSLKDFQAERARHNFSAARLRLSLKTSLCERTAKARA